MDKPKAVVPHPALPAYYDGAAQRYGFVRDLFDRTATLYDPINLLFSFGLGNWYRRRCLRRAGLRPGMRVLDAAIGTGAIARQAMLLQGKGAEIIGLDVSEGMLAVARDALAIPLVLGCMEDLPIADESVDFVAVGYALRHVADLGAMFGEAHRVLRPGGVLLVLEIGMPARPVNRRLATFYLGRVVPRLSRLLFGRGDAQLLMRYYWDTIINCVPEPVILRAMADAGLAEPRCRVEFELFRSYVGRKT